MRSNLAYTKWLLFSIYISFISMLSCTDHEADFQSDELDYWEQYTTADGLAEEVAKVLFIDSHERIWIGTENKGVSVFDGNTFQKYDTTNGLVNNNITAITEDRINELIWIGTEKGISALNKQGNWESLSEINGAPFSVITLFADVDGILWLGTNQYGLLRFSLTNGLVQYFDEECDACNIVYKIYQSDDGMMWFGTEGGLKRFDGNEFISYTTQDGLPNDIVLSIYEDSWKNLWIGTLLGSYVVYYDKMEFRVVPILNGSVLNFVTSFCEDNTGKIWIGSFYHGLFYYDGAVNRTLNQEREPGEILVNDICIDKSGNLWVATQNSGVWKYINL